MKRWICDGCGTEEEGEDKPSKWYKRSDSDGVQLACSRDCIDIVAKASGKTRVIMPW